MFKPMAFSALILVACSAGAGPSAARSLRRPQQPEAILRCVATAGLPIRAKNAGRYGWYSSSGSATVAEQLDLGMRATLFSMTQADYAPPPPYFPGKLCLAYVSLLGTVARYGDETPWPKTQCIVSFRHDGIPPCSE